MPKRIWDSKTSQTEAVIRHSETRALELAAHLWAISSAQYPQNNTALLDAIDATTIDALSSFAVNARRCMERPGNISYALTQHRWEWSPTGDEPLVGDLKDALNRIIHAQVLLVGFEILPPEMSVIDGGSVVIPYVMIRTDYRQLSFVDPFSIAYAFLYGPLGGQDLPGKT